MMFEKPALSVGSGAGQGDRQRFRMKEGYRTVLKVFGLSSLVFLLARPLSFPSLDSLGISTSSPSVDPLDAWIATESEFAFHAILDNTGRRAGAGEGLVIASPSRKETDDQPDYFYTWTRDSALTFSSLLPHFLPDSYLSPWTFSTSTPEQGDSYHLLEPLMRSYIQSQAKLQVLENLSGKALHGGLNEPKFEANGTVFNGNWGRPQRDGPALRVLALVPYANFLLDRGFTGDIEFVRKRMYDPGHIRREGSVIKNDLEEVAAGWSQEGFDLWEEVDGHHLFTRLASFRALQAGALLAARLGDPGAAEWYAKTADHIESRVAYFWVYSHHHTRTGYWAASTFGKDQLGPSEAVPSSLAQTGMRLSSERSGLDCAFCLSVIHAGSRRRWNDTAEHGWTSFEPAHPGVIGTLREYAKSFGGLYAVNEGVWTDGWLLGRYTEDVYDGVRKSKGNPWFICTFSFAHTLYLAHASFVKSGSIAVNPHTRPFWTDVLKAQAISNGDIWTRGKDEQYDTALSALWQIADNYLRVAQNHVGTDGRMSEQVHRSTGKMRGARDLTWSYASFIEVARARDHAKAIWTAAGGGVPRETGEWSATWLSRIRAIAGGVL